MLVHLSEPYMVTKCSVCIDIIRGYNDYWIYVVLLRRSRIAMTTL
jgi:hypothetical protein